MLSFFQSRKSNRVSKYRPSLDLEALEARWVPAVRTWLGSSDVNTGTLWHVPANWVEGAVPTAADTARFTINGVTHPDGNGGFLPGPWTLEPSVEATTLVGGVEFDASWTGNLRVDADLLVESVGTWANGTVTFAEGRKMVTTGTFTLNNTSPIQITGPGSFTNSGNLVVAAPGGVRLNQGASLINQGGATLQLQTDTSFVSDVGQTGRFTNAGFLNKTGGSDTTFFGTANVGNTFITQNTGTFRIATGKVSVLDTFQNFDGTAKSLTGGIFDLAGVLQIASEDLKVNASTVILDGTSSDIQNAFGQSALSTLASNSANGSLTLKNGRSLKAGSSSSVVSSFNPGLGSLVGIAFDPSTGQLLLHPDFDPTIYKYNQVGTRVGTVQRPGAVSNEFDLDYLSEPLNINGNNVPAGSILVVNGDNSPDMLYAIDKNTGALLASMPLPGVDNAAVGVAYHPGRNSIYVLDTVTLQIQEINPATGAQIQRFPVVPPGAPNFAMNFGDLMVNPDTGNLFVVGHSQTLLREMSPVGEFLQDRDIGVVGMSGIARDPTSGDFFFSTVSGTVFRVADFRFTNAGQVRVEAGGAFSTNGQRYLQTGGATVLSPGSIVEDSVDIRGGSLIGTGFVEGTLKNAGTVEPGNGVGTLVVNGAYQQTGTLRVEINGTVVGGQHDQLVVHGSVSLAGTITGTLGYTPALGDSYLVIANDLHDSATGTLTGITEGGNLAIDGKLFRVTYADGDLRLTRNIAPTDITLSANATPENNAALQFGVGILGSNDPDETGTVTYSLVPGTGAADNASFIISGIQLRTNTKVDYEKKSSYTIRIRATDQSGLFVEEVFTIVVRNINEKPFVHVRNYNAALPTKPIYTILRNGSFTFRVADRTGVTVTDLDEPGSANDLFEMRVQVSDGKVTLPSRIGLTSVLGNDTANLRFVGKLAAVNAALNGLKVTPRVGFTGKMQITFTINDRGNAGFGIVLSDTKTIRIQVNNLAPKFPVAGLPNPLKYTLAKNVNVLTASIKNGVVRGVKDRNGDVLTARLLTAPPAKAGKLVLKANGSFTFTRKATFKGTTSFVYRLFDGLAYSGPIRVTLVAQ